MRLRAQQIAHAKTLDESSGIVYQKAGIIHPHPNASQYGIVPIAERVNNGLAKRPTIVKRCWLAKKPYLDLCNWTRNGGILSRNYGIDHVITGLFRDRRRRRSPQANFARARSHLPQPRSMVSAMSDNASGP